MEYCLPNITLSEVWIWNKGMPQFHMDSVTTVAVGFLLVFATIRIIKYIIRNITEISCVKSSKVFLRHLFFTLCLPALESISQICNNILTYENENKSTSRNILSKLRVVLPYLWPKGWILKLHVTVCILLQSAGRVINLSVPIYSKKIVDSLTETPLSFRWDLVVIFMVFKLLQDLLNDIHYTLWIKVQQYINRKIQLDLFRHLHNLPLQWHLSRKTGEVLRVFERGTASVENLLDYFLFSIIPTFVDITGAIVFFAAAFNMWFGLIALITMVLYIILTTAITEWRTKSHHSANRASDELEARVVDSLLNFETIKYYTSEPYELATYRDALLRYQKEDLESSITTNLIDMVQNFVTCIGLLCGTLLTVSMIINTNELTVGDYVLFTSYIVQLYMPLDWLCNFYRIIQRNFVDMESMMDILRAEPEEHGLVDQEQAEDKNQRNKESENKVDKEHEFGGGELQAENGSTQLGIECHENDTLEFHCVSFSYGSDKLALKDISFKVQAGSIVALVGPSGSGKSSIARLVFRLYDVTAGAVLVGGRDIRTISRASLRACLAIVPQDTVLFNNTIRFNIQYGRPNATEAEIISAAKNADIHDKIMMLPDAYDTQVGERGLRLSGGERQKIAIARAMLKDPKILVLDEATSALDTNTERHIQAALKQVYASRTTLIIAHRLSTITHADQILVLKDGVIIERGSHESLLTQNGYYASMWQKQVKNKPSDENKIT